MTIIQTLAAEELVSTKTLWNAIEALVSAIDARNGSIGHSMRVATYAVQIAEAMGYQAQTLEQIYLGALLHDIGQIYWPEEILHNYKAPLTENERKIIESHTYKGADLITNWPQLHFVRPYILYHQEWIDGSGYPFGLKGDALPTEVQIVSLADVFEALHHPRLYKKRAGYSCQKALAIMDEMKGKRWKLDLFETFAEIVNNGIAEPK